MKKNQKIILMIIENLLAIMDGNGIQYFEVSFQENK